MGDARGGQCGARLQPCLTMPAASARRAGGSRRAPTRTLCARAARRRLDQDRPVDRRLPPPAIDRSRAAAGWSIVDEADRLTDDAENALLKSLEEPPPASVFILVTSRPEMLLRDDSVAVLAAEVRAASAGEVARAPGRAARCAERRGARDCRGGRRQPGARARGGFQGATATLGGGAVARSGPRRRATSPKARLQAAAGLMAGKPSSAGEREELATRIYDAGVAASRPGPRVASRGAADELANARPGG